MDTEGSLKEIKAPGPQQLTFQQQGRSHGTGCYFPWANCPGHTGICVGRGGREAGDPQFYPDTARDLPKIYFPHLNHGALVCQQMEHTRPDAPCTQLWLWQQVLVWHLGLVLGGNSGVRGGHKSFPGLLNFSESQFLHLWSGNLWVTAGLTVWVWNWLFRCLFENLTVISVHRPRMSRLGQLKAWRQLSRQMGRALNACSPAFSVLRKQTSTG